MTSICVDKKVPVFEMETTLADITSLKDFKGKNLVLYFYPKDNTPGCTTESQNFRDCFQQFEKLNTAILGCSRDSIASHHKFIEKQNLPFPLISDPEEIICELFDVMKMKNMYGKSYRGIERSTFLIDTKGVLQQEWRKVKVTNHVDDVLSKVKALK